MFPFWLFTVENTEESNYLYSIIGKILMIATRYENYCKNLNFLILAKQERIYQNSNLTQKDLNDFFKKNTSTNLHANIEKIYKILHRVEKFIINDKLDKKEDSLAFMLKDILHKARDIRNNFVHEMTLGLDNERFKGDTSFFLEELKNQAEIILEAELAIIQITAALTRDEIPNKNYMKRSLSWIFYQE